MEYISHTRAISNFFFIYHRVPEAKPKMLEYLEDWFKCVDLSKRRIEGYVAELLYRTKVDRKNLKTYYALLDEFLTSKKIHCDFTIVKVILE